MIGYEMDSSLARVYTTPKTSHMKNLKLNEKMTWMSTWQHFWLRGGRSSFLSNLKQETWPLEKLQL